MQVINNSNFMSLICDISDEIVENKTTDFNSTYDQIEHKLITTFNLERLENNNWLVKGE
jgi:hypothetical protein|tara:strand:- start:417 stop:593 length:177 start_codon:yes stop_codon:yes gene_type:complete